MRGEPFHVNLVDDELLQGKVGGRVALPVESVVDDDRLGNDPDIVARVDGEILHGRGGIVREK